MPKKSWREAYKGGDKKKTARVKVQRSKDQFKKWYEGKLKAKERFGKLQKNEGKGKGESKGKGKGKDKGKGKGRGDHGGKGGGSTYVSGGSFASEQPRRPSLESAQESGVGKEMMAKLQATKQRLLLGNAEAARAGAVKAEPGAFAAAAAAMRGKDMISTGDAEGGEAGGSQSSGKGRGKGKDDGKGRGRGRGLGEDGKGRGRGRGGERSLPPKLSQGGGFRTDEERLEIFNLNKKMSEHGQAKDLAAVREVLASLEDKKWANAYSYATAVNALCRCGDWQGAEAALERGDKSGFFKKGNGASSGVVARTSMLRGYCENARDIAKAKALLQKMESHPLMIARPNVRTANTFLRGCLLLGDVSDAEALLNRMEDKWSADELWKSNGGVPDASSYETVVSLLCQALRYKDAAKVAEKALSKLGVSPGSGAMFVGIARAAAVCGNWDAAIAATKKAKNMLNKEEAGSGDRSSASDLKGSGGKRGTAKEGVDDSARTKSLELFQTHRRGELLAELKEVEVFCKKCRTPDLSCLYSRTIVFGNSSSSESKPEGTAVSAADAMCKRLSDTFGLQTSGDNLKATKRSFETAFQDASAGPIPAGLSRKKRRKLRQSQGNGDAADGEGLARLDLKKLFAPVGDDDSSARPLHLELCSGGGEWALAQAARDTASSWVACELRFDRSTRCIQRMALRRLASKNGNVGIIAGDADEALRRRLTVGSCDRLFINHPEPPHQTDLEKLETAAAASGSHLLTADFLQHACAPVLKPGGTLTICTDSPEYGKWLRRTLDAAPLNEVFEDAIKSGKDGGKKLRVRTEPPAVDVCGAEYTGEAGASYFQRLKQSERGSRGQEDENRYFLCLRRR